MELVILLADPSFLVVDKPAGLLSVPGIGPANADCLVVRIQRQHPTARIVHRLDQATSGAMVLALDADSHRDLSRQFEARRVEKVYEAIVAGMPEEDEGVVDLPMRKDMERKARHLIDSEQGKPAVTRWRVLERLGERARLELRPLTGRSHQLRVHMAAAGHAILGDDIYAPPEVAAAAPRLLLHATSLAFDDPRRGVRVEARSFAPF